MQQGDIIQVRGDSRHEAWAGCLLIVDEVKSWGIVACCRVPGKPGIAYLRLEEGQYLRAGGRAVLPSRHPDDED